MMWIKRHWLAAIGYLSLALNVIRIAFEATGDIDLYLAHQNGQEVTWLGHLLDFVASPPPLVVAAAILGGLFLIWWDARRNPKIVHHHSATVQLRGVQAEAEAGRLSNTSLNLADKRMPLIELRAMAIKRGWPTDIDPRTASSVWLSFISGLRQAAIDGDIAFFGRGSRSDSDEIVLHEPLKPVEASHWAQFKIDPISFLTAGINLRIESRDSNVRWQALDSFRDLHVDRESATKWLENFPVQQAVVSAMSGSGPVYMTARDVIHYLRDVSRWGRNRAVEVSPEGAHYNVGLEAPFEFARGASEGGVFAVGRRDGIGEHIEMPSTYWLSGALDILEALREGGMSRTAPTVPNGSIIYDDVRIKAEDVRSKWPPA